MVRLLGLASLAMVGTTMAFIPPTPIRPSAVWGVRPSTVLKMSATEALETRVERRPNSTVSIFVTVPGDMTQKAFEKAVQELSQDPKLGLTGFRKGAKVPEQYVVNAAGGDLVVKNKALENLCDDALNKAVQKSQIKAVGQATLVSEPTEILESYKPGSPLQIEMKIDVAPEVQFSGSYKGLKVTADRIPPDNEAVEKALDALKKRKVKLEDTAPGYAAQVGDSAFVNMKAFQKLSDGSRGPELERIAAGENVEVILEEGRFLPGVVEGVVGAKAGDVRVIDVTFPSNVREAKLAGLKAEFEVEILSIKSRKIPELTDEFANSLREGLTVEGLLKEVRDAVNADADAKTKDNLYRALEDALVAITIAEVPETWIVDETRRKFATMMQEFSQQGKSDEEIKKMISKENFEKYRQIAYPGTIRTLKLSSAVAKVAELEQLKVDAIELQDQFDIRRIEAQRQGIDEDTMKQTLESKMLSDKVYELLASTAEITYKDVDPASLKPPQ